MLGITASPKEYDAFVKLATQNPTITKTLQRLFRRHLHQQRPAAAALRHRHAVPFLRVPARDANDAYGALTDREVIDLFTAQTDTGGYMLFYTGSFAYASAEPIIADWATTAPVEEVAAFKTLRVFRKTG